MANQGNQTTNQSQDNSRKDFSSEASTQPDGMSDAELQKTDNHLSTDDDENAGAVRSTPLMNRAESQVRENEDASLQDDSYTFDSDNTDSEEGIDDFDVEDAGGWLSDFDLDTNDDFV